MTTSSSHSFTLKPTEDWKSRSLVYEEPGFKLEIYLEVSGSRRYDYVGPDTDLEYWTISEGQIISLEKRTEILYRLEQWSNTKKLRIHLSPPLTMDDIIQHHNGNGWTMDKEANGDLSFSPPANYSLVKKIRDTLKGYKRK